MFNTELQLNVNIHFYEVQNPINLFFAKNETIFRGSRNEREPVSLKKGNAIVRFGNHFYLRDETDKTAYRLLDVSVELITSNPAIFEEMTNNPMSYWLLPQFTKTRMGRQNI